MRDQASYPRGIPPQADMVRRGKKSLTVFDYEGVERWGVMRFIERLLTSDDSIPRRSELLSAAAARWLAAWDDLPRD